MKAICCFLFVSIISLNNAFTAAIMRRRLGPEPVADVFEIRVDVRLHFPNFRLKKAYYALQEWKKVITSDPKGMTKNWDGIDVCSYNGVFCAKAPDAPNLSTVAVVDLNHGDIEGKLPPHLGLISDLSAFHINSNRFCGTVPNTFSRLTILNEFDISNNQFDGPFPNVVLDMPKLKYLDIRYNNFQGLLPPQLFDKDLDAIFLNHNRFSSTIPENIGNSKASVIVFADNEFKGHIPKSIGQMANLDEIIFANNQLSGCLPEELGLLHSTKVLDLSNNNFVGPIPRGIGNLKCIEMVDVAQNELIGTVVDVICTLPKLLNFTFSDNYFDRLEGKCEKPMRPELVFDYRRNCLRGKPDQKDEGKCLPVVKRQIDCESLRSVLDTKRRKPPMTRTRTTSVHGSITVSFRH
ncbi:putative leucine-rich repeat-containing, plant-type, leucine-rich repeat domain superfamily [Helianthus debilis subsp. tardiflorus]